MIVLTEKQIADRYNVTPEQMDRVTRLIDMISGAIYFKVSSQTTDDTEYEVRYHLQFRKLSCDCKAGQNGLMCWHKRAATAVQHEVRQAENLAYRKEAEAAAYKAECERIQKIAQDAVSAKMIELRKQREDAKKNGGFCLLRK